MIETNEAPKETRPFNADASKLADRLTELVLHKVRNAPASYITTEFFRGEVLTMIYSALLDAAERSAPPTSKNGEAEPQTQSTDEPHNPAFDDPLYADDPRFSEWWFTGVKPWLEQIFSAVYDPSREYTYVPAKIVHRVAERAWRAALMTAHAASPAPSHESTEQRIYNARTDIYLSVSRNDGYIAKEIDAILRKHFAVKE